MHFPQKVESFTQNTRERGKFEKKDCGKVLTMEKVGDIITKLSTKAAADRTLKIEQHSRRTRRIKPLYSFE